MIKTATKPVVDDEEQKYREELFPDVKKIIKKNALCTSCNTSVIPLVAKGKPRTHPFLETLLCEKCHNFYGDGDFSVDEDDGSDKYCRWCGQGGTLYLCSKCTAGFCKKCIKRNLPRAVWKEVEEDDWECLACNVKPLYELRAFNWAAQEYAALKEKASSSKKRKVKDLSDDELSNEGSKKSKENASSDDEKAEEKASTAKGKTRRKSVRDKASKSKSAPDEEPNDEEAKEAAVPAKKPSKAEDKSKLKVKQFKKAREEMGTVIDNLVKIADITKKKATEYRKKKITPSKLGNLDALSTSSQSLITLLLSAEETTRDLRQNFELFLTKFKDTVREMDEEAEKKEDAANGDVIASEENGNGSPTEDNQKDEESTEKNVSSKPDVSDGAMDKSVENDKENEAEDDRSNENESPIKTDDSTNQANMSTD